MTKTTRTQILIVVLVIIGLLLLQNYTDTFSAIDYCNIENDCIKLIKCADTKTWCVSNSCTYTPGNDCSPSQVANELATIQEFINRQTTTSISNPYNTAPIIYEGKDALKIGATTITSSAPTFICPDTYEEGAIIPPDHPVPECWQIFVNNVAVKSHQTIQLNNFLQLKYEAQGTPFIKEGGVLKNEGWINKLIIMPNQDTITVTPSMNTFIKIGGDSKIAVTINNKFGAGNGGLMIKHLNKALIKETTEQKELTLQTKTYEVDAKSDWLGEVETTITPYIYVEPTHQKWSPSTATKISYIVTETGIAQSGAVTTTTPPPSIKSSQTNIWLYIIVALSILGLSTYLRLRRKK